MLHSVEQEQQSMKAQLAKVLVTLLEEGHGRLLQELTRTEGMQRKLRLKRH